MQLLLAVPMFMLLASISITILPEAQAQVIVDINQTQPCFLNYSAGLDLWENCGIRDDYLTFALLPWEWITGGNFSMVLVSILSLMTYIKYHKAIYPIVIGVMFLPISYFAFPDSFLTFSLIMAGAAIGILIWYIFIKQTKEY